MGLVSQTLIQHEDKHGARCPGSGQAPVTAAPRASGASSSGSGGTTRAKSAGSAQGAAKKSSSPATKGSLTVRRVEVDPEALRERQERAERLRLERAEAARARNEVNVSYFDEPGH